jgi:hypothetical protein
MARNVYTAVAAVIGMVLIGTAVLDWVSYTGFIFSLLWR